MGKRSAWVVMVGLLAGLLAGPGGTPSAAASGGTTERLYVDPDSDAARAAASAASDEDRQALQVLAARPTAVWFGDWIPTTSVGDRSRSLLRRAAATGSTAVLVAYAVPGRDCQGHSAGGLDTGAAYRAWIDALASGLGASRSIVVVEPDGLAQLDCLPVELRAERVELLRYAVTRLSQARSTRVYLDAGHSHWVPAGEMASRLRAAGVARARGFSLNVSNFHETAGEEAYGRTLSQSLGGKPFVIDTSRNGSGRGDTGWCNPPGRSLGTVPTTRTGRWLVDAYLYVKTPGRSDGPCGRDEPAAGVFWPQYAIDLVRATV